MIGALFLPVHFTLDYVFSYVIMHFSPNFTAAEFLFRGQGAF